MRNNKVIHVSNYINRKKFYFVNCILSLIMRLSGSFRDKKLWIFSCWEGKRYDDNSRYLFEYILENHKEITTIWVTRSQTIYGQLVEKKLPVVLADSVEGKKIMKKAGVAFYTNGLDDFSPICWLYGAVLIHLSHAATGIKKSGFAKENYKDKKLKLFLKKIKDSIFDWYYFTFNIATSEESKLSRIGTYGNNKSSRIIITGLPRNDILRYPSKFKLNKPRCIEDGFINILYLPTYRAYQNTVVNDLILSILDDKDFNNLLSELKIKILIKFHEADRISEIKFDNMKNIVLLQKEDVESTQELLVFCDALITDYSSCCIDFALTNKPNIIYAPDYLLYDTMNGISDKWKPIYESEKVLKNAKQLKEALINIGDKKYQQINDWINMTYEDNSIKEKMYCENVYLEVMKNIKEKRKK